MSKETVNAAMQLRAEQVRKGAELLLDKTKDWQVIQQYLNNRLTEEFLTEQQKEKLKRYQYIYNQLSSGRYTEQEVIQQLTNSSLFGVGLTQAYEDISSTKEIFPSFININKRFEIQLQLQINRDMQRKAAELGDFKSYAAIEKNRAALLALLPDEEEAPGEYFEGHVLEATFNPALLGVPAITKEDMKKLLEDINAKRRTKINLDFIEDIPFENVK